MTRVQPLHVVVAALLLLALCTGCQSGPRHQTSLQTGITPLPPPQRVPPVVRPSPRPPQLESNINYSPPRPSRGAVMEPSYRQENDSELRRESFRWLGVPYRVGGMSKAGADCSGFVCAVYLDVFGKRLPRTSMTQFNYGQPVQLGQLVEGDLVFFQTSKQAPVTHVGIYLDGGRFIHASTKRGVIVSELKEGYYSERYRGARRVVKRSTAKPVAVK